VSQKTRKIPKSTKFEDALGELETIVTSLEGGEQSLEQSLEQFERGVSLARFCQQSLSDAERFTGTDLSICPVQMPSLRTTMVSLKY